MDEWKMRLHDELAAPPGFADAVMAAIDERNTRQVVERPIYSPVTKGILCIAAAVLLLVLSMPKLDTAWSTLAKMGPGLRVTRGTQGTEVPPDEDDGLRLPGGPVLYISNR
jgi:hypothetical protein